MSQLSPCTWIRHSLIGVLLTLSGGVASAQIVSQSPLSVTANVPGNLLLVPSVEWPTVDSIATLDNTFNNSRIYVGYFDSGKCYTYVYDAVEANRYFKPVSVMPSMNPTPPTAPVPGTCNGINKEWSGNFLNWALTQTIDPFRKALTGGYRVRDTSTETWLEKAWSDGNAGTSIFPDRVLSSSVSSYAPAGWNSLKIKVRTLGNKLRITSTGTDTALSAATVTAYNPSMTLGTSNPNNNAANVYELSARVKVCDPSVGVEANCKQYTGVWKPEGLIQKYSDRIRYSVFGYLNDVSPSPNRDGGALRAQQKFVGPMKRDPVTHGMVTNSANEWDTTTGVFVRNPDSTDATNTTLGNGRVIADSGVINYLNKFGQMPADPLGDPNATPNLTIPANHKTYDPVSELYYAATRYLKNLGNVPEYTNWPAGATGADKYKLADGFPVITTWDDPIQYWCQNNTILGIGDVNTWYDKNLPGSTFTTNEPSKPALVTADTSVNVKTALDKIAALEGITIKTPMDSGRDNSAYIAALAYDNHTKDMRPTLQGTQTASTYWVDVREAQTLQPKANNQYWLAAKYGGFVVPKDFAPYAATTTSLDTSWWNSAGDKLSTNDLRPDNFFVASEADKMVESLTKAFAKISGESTGSSSSLAANSTRLDTSTRTFQALFVGGTWRGDLVAYAVLTNGNLASTSSWSAGTLLLAAPWANRNIHTYDGTNYISFANYSNLSSAQKTAIGSQTVVDYLRGKRSDEDSQSGGTLRTRSGVLGDIVNSTPIFVGAPNSRLYVNATFSGASDYGAFVTAKANRTPVVYVGANDGMLHAFNANTGAEIYAYIPNSVILNDLKSYSDPNYQHKYFVDGETAVADIYDKLAAKWKTVLVGSLGRGGPGLFALDVTDPANIAFLWEKNASDIPTLGKNIGKPVIAQVADGDWRVFLGNGPDGTGGKATLISVGLINGTVATIDTGDTGGGNGLSAVLARDSNGDGFADAAYAGDLKGNVWRITGLGGTGSAMKLFTATDANSNAQPITAAPLAGKDPATGKIWVFVGTGQYLSDTDPTTTGTQTWYGLIDGTTAIASRNSLVARVAANGAVSNGFTTRTVDTGNATDLDGKRGWYIDLPSSGERMVVPNRFEGNALVGTTRIPDSGDVCAPSGKGFIMSINPFTGARLNDTFFDLNGDGVFDNSDKANGGQIVSGIGFDSSPNNPIFIDNVMEVSLDNGTTKSIKTQGTSVDAKRMSWRELVN